MGIIVCYDIKEIERKEANPWEMIWGIPSLDVMSMVQGTRAFCDGYIGLEFSEDLFKGLGEHCL